MKSKNNQKISYPKVGIYEHYKSSPKSRRYYQIIGFARHTETEEILVVYVPLYVLTEHNGPRLQARPLAMFCQKIEINGKIKSRFRYIGQEL